MSNHKLYDIIVIGGGLAGLSLAIQAAQKGYSVILFEKEQYPYHKVCGEYISLESWNFIESLGLPLSSMQLPIIKKLIISSPNGNMLETSLPLGGFGISRYLIDNELKKIAQKNDVAIYENCKVNDVLKTKEHFIISTQEGEFYGKICCGSFGKRSNLDIKWHRKFAEEKPNKLNNYIAVKYHIQLAWPNDTIALHNFENGYCGISKIENDQYCLCYLTTAENLQANKNSIQLLEQNILCKNPHLKKIFSACKFIFPKPLAISQISFLAKTQVENDILMLGDAAGMITPLCGNGMSMALHSSKIAMDRINAFFHGKISSNELKKQYSTAWKRQFAKRIQTGRLIQRFFGKIWLTNLFVKMMKLFPRFTHWLIQKTHGEAF